MSLSKESIIKELQNTPRWWIWLSRRKLFNKRY